MSFSPPPDAMAVDEPPPNPVPTSHGRPSEDEMAVDEPAPKHGSAPTSTSHGSPLLDEEDVRVIDPPPPKPARPSRGSGGANARPWSAEVEEMKSSLDIKKLLSMCRKFGIGEKKYRAFCPEDGGGPCKTPSEDSVCVYKVMLEVGVRFPLHDFYTKILNYYRIAPSQLTPMSWRYLIGFVLVCDGAGVKPTVAIFRNYFRLKAAPGSKLQGWYSFVPHSSRLFFSAAAADSFDGWKKLFFFLESRSAQTAWRCPTKWGKPSQHSLKAPVLKDAAKEAIKKLEPHTGKSLRSLLSKCDKFPVLSTPEQAPVQGGPTSPPRGYRTMSSFVDPPPQQLAGAMASSPPPPPPPELGTPEPAHEIPVRADSRDGELEHSQIFRDNMSGAYEAMRRTEKDLRRVKDELLEERSKHAADVAQLTKELEAEKAKSEATVRQLTEELETVKTKASQLAKDFCVAEAKHAAEVKALNDKVTHAQGQALRETCNALMNTIEHHLLANYPSTETETAIQTPPPGFPPLQAPVTHVDFHQTSKQEGEEVEAREGTKGTNQIMQDLMMTRCPSINPAILRAEVLPSGFPSPSHQAPDHQ